MDWFSGPLSHIWGIPIFWFVRIAKVLQFASALVIVIEIVGKERVEKLAGVTQKRLEISSNAIEWIKKKDEKIIEKTKEIFPEEPPFKYDPEADRIEGYLGCISIVVVIGLVIGYRYIPWLADNLILALKWVVGIPLFLCLVGTILLLPLFLGSIMLQVVNIFIIYPILWIMNRLLTSTIRILENKGLAHLLLIMSLCLLTLGFVVDLLAS